MRTLYLIMEDGVLLFHPQMSISDCIKMLRNEARSTNRLSDAVKVYKQRYDETKYIFDYGLDGEPYMVNRDTHEIFEGDYYKEFKIKDITGIKAIQHYLHLDD